MVIKSCNCAVGTSYIFWHPESHYCRVSRCLWMSTFPQILCAYRALHCEQQKILRLSHTTTHIQHVRGNNVNKYCAKSRQKIVLGLIVEYFANNNVKLHYFCHNFDSHNFTRQCLQICEVKWITCYATQLSINC